MLINGSHLGSKLRADVLSRYIYRWTTGNPHRDTVYRSIGAPTIDLISDEQWLAEHAFYVTKQGNLDGRRNHCEPSYLK